MKKQIPILFTLFIYLQSYCQQIITTTTANCDDSLYMSLTGKWKKELDYPGSTGFSKTEQLETFKRLDAIHKLVLEAYPVPKGLDAMWRRTQIYNGFLAQETKFSKDVDGRLRKDYIKGTAVGKYTYTAGFFHYYCFNDVTKREVRVNGESGTWLLVKANELWTVTGDIGDDTMAVDGRPVFLLYPKKEIWKGQQMFFTGATSSSQRTVLVHRNGILPYLPVTRKQYFDHSIPCVSNHFDQLIKTIELEGAFTLREQEEKKQIALKKIEQDYKNDPQKIEAAKTKFLANFKNEQEFIDAKKAKVENQRILTLKLYRQELEKTKMANLLDSPVVVFVLHHYVLTEAIPIFITEKEGGKMLVTENPAYIRKDLPKYVPQFFIVHWTIDPGAPGEYLRKSIEEYFPIEKLQAMIDK